MLFPVSRLFNLPLQRKSRGLKLCDFGDSFTALFTVADLYSTMNLITYTVDLIR